eukprot:2031049-Rhodomonas_salina.1
MQQDTPPQAPAMQDSASTSSPLLSYSHLLDPFANSTVRRRRVRDGGKRNKLSFEVVLAIFERRPLRSEVDGTFVPCAKLCRELSKKYNVQARTIRDIWNRRSWGFVTRPLWTLAEIAAEQGIQDGLNVGSHTIAPVQMRKRGRPHGAKDTVKRRRKTDDCEADPTDSAEECAEPVTKRANVSQCAEPSTTRPIYSQPAVPVYNQGNDFSRCGGCAQPSEDYSKEDDAYPLWDDNVFDSYLDAWSSVPLPAV